MKTPTPLAAHLAFDTPVYRVRYTAPGGGGGDGSLTIYLPYTTPTLPVSELTLTQLRTLLGLAGNRAACVAALASEFPA